MYKMTQKSKVEENLLILRSILGNEEAFEALIDLYNPRLSYYLRRILDSNDDVNDVLQEVWYKVYKNLPKLKTPEAFPRWLYKSARNAAYDFMKSKRSKELHVEYLEELEDHNLERRRQ